MSAVFFVSTLLFSDPQLLDSSILQFAQVNPATDLPTTPSVANLDRPLVEGLFNPISFGLVLATLLTIALTWTVMRAVAWLSNLLSEQVPRRFRLTIKQLVPFVQGGILFSSILTLGGFWLNLSATNVFALSGTIAVALGFAFKDFASSIIAGVIALYEAPYRVGDRVQIGQHYGEVISFRLRTIRLRTPDDNIITLPHSVIWTDSISNANDGALEAQVAVDVYVDHGADIEAAVRILYLAAYTSKYTQLKLPITVVASEKPWCTHLKLKCYPMDARDEFSFKTDLLTRSKQSFKTVGIQYPHVPPDLQD